MYPNIDLKHLASLVIKELKNLKGDQRLDITNIRNGEQLAIASQKNKFSFNGASYGIEELMHGGGGSGSGTPSDPTTSLQFNNSGSFGGDSDLTWDNTNKNLSIGAAINAEHITSVSLSFGGSGYTSGNILVVDSGNGDATVSVDSEIGGVITSISLVSGGTGYSTGIVGVTGGSGNNATVHILAVGTSISAGQVNVNQPAIPTESPLNILGNDGYIRFSIDTDGRFAVAGPTNQFTVFDRNVTVNAPSDAISSFTFYVSTGVLAINSVTGSGDVMTLDGSGNLAITGAITAGDGSSGSFTTVDSKTVTVVNGIITAIV